jgi:hypothetical protein
MVPVRRGPFSALSDDCTVLSHNQQPQFAYLQRFNVDMSSDLEWLLLRVCDIYNTLIELTLL